MMYEKKHLEQKLTVRDPDLLEALEKDAHIEPHPMFTVVDGNIEAWKRRE